MLHSVIYNYKKINKDLEKSGQGKNYDIDRSKKRFSGFTRFHNSIVEDKYNRKQAIRIQFLGGKK